MNAWHRAPGLRRGVGGFTLIELLVALTITAAVIAAAYAAVRIAADAAERGQDHRALARSGRSRRATLDGWLRGAARLDGAGTFVGVDRGTDELPLDEVSFGVADAGTLYPGPHRVHLWVDRDQATPRQGLLAELTPIRDGRLGRPDTVEMVRSAIGLALRYYAYIDAKDRWIDAWRADTLLPRAVEMRVVVDFGPAADDARAVAPAARGARPRKDLAEGRVIAAPFVAVIGWGAQ